MGFRQRVLLFYRRIFASFSDRGAPRQGPFQSPLKGAFFQIELPDHREGLGDGS